MFSALGNLIVTPFAALFRWLYSWTGSYGIAIILFGLVVKLVVLPFQMKSKRGMVRMGRLSDKQQELQKKYANNQQKYQEELQKLYMDEGVNPMGGCLWSFLPLFLLIPLYSIIRKPLTSMMMMSTSGYNRLLEMAQGMGFQLPENNYNPEISLTRFVSDHWESFEGSFPSLLRVDYDFLGGLDLSVVPQDLLKAFEFTWPVIGVLLIPVVSALLSFVMNKVTMASNGQKSAGQQAMMMNLMMPLMSLWIGFTLPAALGLYWIVNSVFAMIQEAVLGRFYTRKIEAEEEEREAKRAAARQMRAEEARKREQERREEELLHPKAKQKKPETAPKEKKPPTTEAGRVGERPYARGRSYQENRYEQE